MKLFGWWNTRPRPAFLVIGAQKCGTTWLHHHLRLSEDVWMPDDKDYEHFSYVGNLNRRAFSVYCKRFTSAPQGQLIGDANAAYFWTRTQSDWNRQPDSFNPEIPRSVRKFLGPDLKLVVILRDPVDRAVSAYLHHLRYGAVTPEISILDASLPLGIVDMGFYRQHWENWLEVYPREQFHVINGLPGYGEQAAAVMNPLLDFLGAARIPVDGFLDQPVYPGYPRLVDESGVWLDARTDWPGKAEVTDLPECEIDGQRFIRVISPESIHELREVFGDQSVP